MRILTILVRYGSEQYPAAEQEMSDLVAAYMPEIEREIIVVDNALPEDTVERSARRTLIGGDNRLREFTAFDRAVAWCGRELGSFDLIHISTSAFNTLCTGYLERFSAAALHAAAACGVCLGHIDCHNEPVRLRSFVSQHWIRTCFFFLPPSEILTLRSFVSMPDGGSIYSGNPAAPFRPDAPLSPNYQRYILEWLTGGDVGQGVRWHSRLELTPEALVAFEQKALCIVNEHLLACRLRAAGCLLVDVTWLSNHLDEALETGSWPSWRRQLANRDRDRVAVCTPPHDQRRKGCSQERRRFHRTTR